MADTIVERWLPVVGYEGLYSVSDLGRVRSEPKTVIRRDGFTQSHRGCIIAGTQSRNGYRAIVLSKNSIKTNNMVHRLVLRAFVGEPPDGHETCHNNGIRDDNRLRNLRWDTLSNNQSDKLLHGTHNRGERHGISKLNNDKVLTIRADTRSYSKIAADYGITPSNVMHIKHRTSWSWLD